MNLSVRKQRFISSLPSSEIFSYLDLCSIILTKLPNDVLFLRIFSSCSNGQSLRALFASSTVVSDMTCCISFLDDYYCRVDNPKKLLTRQREITFSFLLSTTMDESGTEQLMSNLWGYTGVLACIWIVIGIYVASLFYPNYSHCRQFCSELGAVDSPTQKLSPIVNNYPLGLLFILFGLSVMVQASDDAASWTVGLMVVVHGAGTWFAGYFPMDSDPYTNSPTLNCKIHSWAGMIMLLSLIVAPAVTIFDSGFLVTFRLFSSACLLGCFYFSYRLVVAYNKRTNPGVYQRLSYGCQILWLLVYALVVST